MQCWRITKYDPIYRDGKGDFRKEEWQSYSDIGEYYEEKQFTITDYLSAESKYIHAVITLMECMNVSTLKITDVEKYADSISQDKYNSKQMCDMLKNIKNGDDIHISNIPDLCKLILREHLWGKLYQSTMFVHFGYDYYMYVGLQQNCELELNKIKDSGLFVELFTSPYLN